MSTTHTIDSDRAALTAHLTACLDAERSSATLALHVAKAVHGYLAVAGQRFNKRVADRIAEALTDAGYSGVQTYWHKNVGFGDSTHEVRYRVAGMSEWRGCRVFDVMNSMYDEWYRTYGEGVIRSEQRIKRIDAAVDTIDAIVDGIIKVREAEAALRETLNYDGMHNEMHPLAYEVTEARERRR